MKKKQWQKPQLIVLVRSKPGEAILNVCKGGNMMLAFVGAPQADKISCYAFEANGCSICSGISDS